MFKNCFSLNTKDKTVFKQFLLNFFFPKTNVDYFYIFFKFWKGTVIKRKLAYIVTIKFLIVVALYTALKYVFIEFLPLSTTNRIILYDGFNVVLLKQPGSSLMATTSCLFAGWLLHLIYLEGEKDAFPVCIELLFTNKVTSLYWREYKGRDICKYLTDFANKVLIFGPVLMSAACK